MIVDVCGSQDRVSAAILIAIVLVVLKASVLYRGPETSDGPSGDGDFKPYNLQSTVNAKSSAKIVGH